MIRSIKKVLVGCFLFIQLSVLSLAQAGDPSRLPLRAKKYPETISFERCVRTLDKWQERIQKLYDKDPQKVGVLLGLYIEQVEKWNGDRTVFWLFVKNVRTLLKTVMEGTPADDQLNNKFLIKNCIEGIYRLDRMVNKRDSVLAAALSKGNEKEFYDELRDRYRFSKRTVDCVLIL
jgi:hypothetical protein